MSYFTARRTYLIRGSIKAPTFHLFLDPPEPGAPKGQRDSAFINCEPTANGEQPEQYCRTIISRELARRYKRAAANKRYPPLPADNGNPAPADSDEPAIGDFIEITIRNDDDGSRFDLYLTIEEFADGCGDNYLRIGLGELDHYFEMTTDGQSIDLEAKSFDECGSTCYTPGMTAAAAS